MATGAIIARIISQYSDKGTKAAQKDIAKLGANFDKFAKKAAIAFAAVGVVALKVGKDAISAAIDDQKSQVLLANSLRNTVNATDSTIASTEKFITLLQKQVSVADDELRPALSRLVGATGSIEGGQKLLSTALNVSAQSGADLATSSDAIIKAIRGQYKGLALLVPQLSNSTIKSKDFAKALGEVDKATTGAAAKRAGTLEFRLKGLKIAYGEILETLGYALIPVIQNFADVITTKVLPVLEAWINTNKDKLAKGLDTLLTQIPNLIIAMFGFFDFVQRNLKTLEYLGGLLVTIFAATKVYAGITALIGAITALTTAFGFQAAAATAASIATALATAGASVVAATAAIVIIKALTKQTAAVETATTATNGLATANERVRDSYDVKVKPVKSIYDFTNKTLKLTKAQLKAQADQILSEKELAKLKAMGVVPRTEVDPIQLEAVRLNLIKEQNLAQKAMYDQLLSAYEAHNRVNIAAQRYADILMVIADNNISEAEVALLASKWGITNYEVAQYIAKVTGNVNLGAGWDAAGLAAGDGWKKALADLNEYLKAVGAANFVAPKFIPPTGGGSTAPDMGTVPKSVVDSFKPPYIAPPVPPIPNPQTSLPDYGAYRAGEQNPIMANPQSILPDYGAFRASERNSSPTVNITVNGSVTSSSDLTETVRNGILAGQTSGRSITARVLDL